MLEQQRDVLAALAQGRQLDEGDADAVVEVGPELLLVAQALRSSLLAATTRQSKGIGLVGADALDAALLQRAQQLDLHRQRHALDLVEEERAAVGVFELADARPAARW